jgi:hypothetical protein
MAGSRDVRADAAWDRRGRCRVGAGHEADGGVSAGMGRLPAFCPISHSALNFVEGEKDGPAAGPQTGNPAASCQESEFVATGIPC